MPYHLILHHPLPSVLTPFPFLKKTVGLKIFFVNESEKSNKCKFMHQKSFITTFNTIFDYTITILNSLPAHINSNNIPYPTNHQIKYLLSLKKVLNLTLNCTQ